MLLNGQFPSTMLANLGWPEADHLRLVPAAAASLTRLAAKFKADHRRPLYVTDAYRTYASQVSLKIIKGVFAATPGTSNHGLGLAVDLASRINVDGSAEHRWMEANGPAFGWINPAWAVDWNPRNGQHEPWHWEYRASLDTRPTATSKPKPALPDPLTPEDDMPTSEEIAAAVWKHPLGPLSGLDVQAAWVHLLATRLTGASTAQALAPISAQVGDATIGPAPLATFVADTRVDGMRALDILRGLTAQVGALQGALSAVVAGAGADPAAIATAAEKGARAALAGLTLTVKP